jgi:hypothetical protein
MPNLQLLDTKFSDKFREWWWTYKFEIIFNKNRIIAVTITDHYQQKHPEITNELILELLNKLNSWKLEPLKYSGQKKVYKWEITYQEKRYRLFFWFKIDTTNHLWIRNCYPI